MPNLELFYARFLYHRISNEEIISLADKLLSSGIYCDALNSIWSSSATDQWKIPDLFKQAILELNIKVPTHKEAGFALLHEELQRVANGDLDLQPCIRLLLDVSDGLEGEFPDNYYLGSGLGLERMFGLLYNLDDLHDEGMYLTFTELQRDETKKKVIALLEIAAKEWIEKYEMDLNTDAV